MSTLDALPLIHSGKVRRLYALPRPDRILMVATDAISAYDQVLTPEIPDKGAVLTQLSLWWFDQVGDIVDNHVLSTDVPDEVAGRAVVCEKLAMVPVECVARGYLTGSAWSEYRETGQVGGQALPAGLEHGARLPEPIFTPARKAPMGEHDENIDYPTLVDMVGGQTAGRLRDLTLALYRRAEGIARERGIILADTKFEFGQRPDGTLVLADEVLTPDSSRFWDAAGYEVGTAEIPSFDKQFVRDWLTGSFGWDRAADQPAPPLPPEVVEATRERYLTAFRLLTGTEFGSAAAQDAIGGGRTVEGVTRFVVEVMPSGHSDPQGQAVTDLLSRLGHAGFTVRQGKRFEIEAAGELTQEMLDEVRSFSASVLANAVTETVDVSVALVDDVEFVDDVDDLPDEADPE